MLILIDMSACSSDATCGRDQRQTLSFLVQRVLIVWLIVFLPGQCADKIRYLLDDYDAMIPAVRPRLIDS